MFRRRQNEDPPALSLEELRDSLSDRLRLVFDFATLGAYDEEVDSIEAGPSGTDLNPSTQVLVRKCREDASGTRRPAQPHVQASAFDCADDSARSTTCAQANGTARPAIGMGAGRRRRAGRVAVPQQPCTWSGP